MRISKLVEADSLDPIALRQKGSTVGLLPPDSSSTHWVTSNYGPVKGFALRPRLRWGSAHDRFKIVTHLGSPETH